MIISIWIKNLKIDSPKYKSPLQPNKCSSLKGERKGDKSGQIDQSLVHTKWKWNYHIMLCQSINDKQFVINFKYTRIYGRDQLAYWSFLPIHHRKYRKPDRDREQDPPQYYEEEQEVAVK